MYNNALRGAVRARKRSGREATTPLLKRQPHLRRYRPRSLAHRADGRDRSPQERRTARTTRAKLRGTNQTSGRGGGGATSDPQTHRTMSPNVRNALDASQLPRVATATPPLALKRVLCALTRAPPRALVLDGWEQFGF